MFFQFLFWFIFVFLAIEDMIFFEVNLLLTLLGIVIFAFSSSMFIAVISITLGILATQNKYIGEADAIFIPIGFYLSDLNPYFFFTVFLFGLIFFNFKEKKSPMLFPICLATLLLK